MSVVVSFAPGPEGEAAVAEAVRQSSVLGRPLVLVSTVPSDDARAAAQESADAVGGRVVQVEEGQDAVEVILDEVAELDPALLVIGLRRRTPVGKLILGSSAQRLLLDAPCPVLAIKPTAH